jgi:hypothetical protein
MVEVGAVIRAALTSCIYIYFFFCGATTDLIVEEDGFETRSYILIWNEALL